MFIIVFNSPSKLRVRSSYWQGEKAYSVVWGNQFPLFQGEPVPTFVYVIALKYFKISSVCSPIYVQQNVFWRF